MFNKKVLIATGVSIVAGYLLFSKNKKNYLADELENIKNYKRYLEKKDFVVLDKKSFKKMNKKRKLGLSAIYNYYHLTKDFVNYLV